MGTKRNKAHGTARRKIATTQTLRQKIFRSTRTVVRRKQASGLNRLLQILAGALLALVLATIVMVLPWRWWAPPASAFMMREKIANDQNIDYRWIPWDRFSPHLAIAVVAAEDQKFATHRGFDFDAIARAMEEKKTRRRGASTISQQVVKNLFLWPGRSYVRKGIEAYLTMFVETLWPKRRILEVYLNVAEWGPGIFGAEAASRHHFNKSAQRLSLWEASLLAAVLPNPKMMSASRPSAYVLRRAGEIRRWVRKLGGRRYLNDI
jgi:monofunctional biosynthetic peptidoglycan transglycosylase